VELCHPTETIIAHVIISRLLTYTYRVIDLTGNRVSAKLAAQFIEDLTPKEELAKLEFDRSAATGVREKGAGRPTKKDRRVIDKLKADFN
jgi:ribosome-associated heat shock protein Hsp15